jgi:Zn-dependent protease with chaperone function
MPTVLMATIVALFDAVGMLFGGNLQGLCRTHPPTEQRVARLLALVQRR